MRIQAKTALGILVVAMLVLATSGCHRETVLLDGHPKYDDFIKSLRPVRVYYENINTVVMLGITNGVEYGKYIRPLISSYRHFDGEGGFRFFTSTGVDAVDMGPNGIADVCDYQRSQQDGAADGSLPIRSGTNAASGAAGSRR